MALANGTTENGAPVKPADQVILGESVTRGDIWPGMGFGASMGGGGAGIMQLVISGGRMIADTELLPPLPGYWSQARDNVLSQSVEYEDFWASAVSITVTKAAATAFEVEGANDLQARKGQELFNDHTNGGQGWAHFVSQNIVDFTCTDKGAFIEIDRTDNAKPGSKVVGLYHLDSHRCWLTGDPDRPVIYMDLHGEYHWLSWWQVFHIADLPNPRNNFFKIGRCAAGRAWRTIRRQVAGEVLDYQEMTGAKANTLELLAGLPSSEQLEGLFETDKAKRLYQNSIVQGNVIMGVLPAKDAPTHITIKLRSKPEGWNQETELELAAIKYSDALGIDKAELKPFTGRMAGTATQSEIQHDKATGKGLALWRNGIQWFFTQMVLPSQASFHWVDTDLGQKAQQAEIFGKWMTGLQAGVGKDGVILSSSQALQKLVDEEQLDREFLPNGQDVTPGVTLQDDDKLLYPAVGDTTAPAQALPQGTPPQPAAPNPAVTQAVGRVRDAITKKLGKVA